MSSYILFVLPYLNLFYNLAYTAAYRRKKFYQSMDNQPIQSIK